MSMNEENKEFRPLIVAFCCNWCSYAGADLAGSSRLSYPADVKIIRVPCSGRVNPMFILRAFERGADGVIICGCHPGDCHYSTGNYYARRRMTLLFSMLDFLGIERDRTRVEWVSAAEGAKFIRLYRNSGSTGIYVANFSIYREKSTPIEHTYTVAGSEALLGVAWDTTAVANDMIKQSDGTYKLIKEDVTLHKNTNYEYKVAIDHKWHNGEASDNSILSVDKDGRYNVTFTYNPDPVAPTTSAVAELIEEIVIDPTAKIMGTLAQNGWDGDDLTLSSDKKSASITLTLVAGNYEFKMFINGEWQSADGEGDSKYTFHRGWKEAAHIKGGSRNMILEADVAGDYGVTWFFENDSLAFTFPAKSDPTAIDNAELGEQAVKMLKDNQVVIIIFF